MARLAAEEQVRRDEVSDGRQIPEVSFYSVVEVDKTEKMVAAPQHYIQSEHHVEASFLLEYVVD